MGTDLQQRLDHGLAALGLDLSADQRRRLLAYVALLAKWNKAFNLTAVREPAQMVTRHLLDSLVLLPHLPAGRLVDVGSGPGLPGIPLAIASPERHFTLVDSNGKKTRFMTQACAEVGVENVTVVNCRIERLQPERPFDAATARAFSSLAALVDQTRHLLAPGGVVLAMKGALPERELEALAPGDKAEILVLAVPGLTHEQRHLIRIVPER